MDVDEREIRALVANWMAATKAGDLEKVLSSMTEDVVFLVAGQPPMIGKASFEKAARAQDERDRPHFDGTSEIQEIKILGDWAYMWSKLTVVVTPSGAARSITRKGHTLSIFKKENGRWLLARDANMLSTVPQEGQ